MAAAEPYVLHRIIGATKGTLLKRYKRFFADVLFEGEQVVAHCPNTGSMTGLLDGLGHTTCLVSHSDNPKRKLKYSLHAISSTPSATAPLVPGALVGIHSASANTLATAALQAGLLDSVFGGATLAGAEKFMDSVAATTKHTPVSAASRKRARGPTPRSRVDLVLARGDGTQVPLEVKSISMADYLPQEEHSDGRDIAHVPIEVYKRTALFPDSVSTRAQRHVEELTAMHCSQSGGAAKRSTAAQTFPQRALANCKTCHAALLLVIQRGDAHAFAPCDRVDPAYGQLLREAVAAGVGVAAMVVDVQSDGTHVFKGTVPVYATHGDAVRAMASPAS